MARPRVADGGDGLQIWRVAANILNNQSRETDKGWSSSLRGLTNQLLRNVYTQPRTWTDPMERPRQRKDQNIDGRLILEWIIEK
jgi:hypothetical protein